MGKGTAFLAGAFIGFAAGIFLAPKPGIENREIAAAKLQELFAQGQECAQQASIRFLSAASETAPAVKQGADQLQEKIDAARKIIAEQVAKNAAETKAALEAKQEVVAEAVEEKVEQAAEAVEEKAEKAEEK